MNIIISQSELFNIPEDITYFNCTYYSPLLNETRRRLLTGAGSKSHPWERTPRDFFRDAETIRNLISDLGERNIFISQCRQSIRIARHLYIDDNDTDRLTGALNELIK